MNAVSQKKFHVMYGIGKAKYVVNFHDGVSKHKDGSNFYDMRIFKNKINLYSFMKELVGNGYIETNSFTDWQD
jgi:hypothetical protein